MLCKHCNAEIGDARRFCPECGQALTEEFEGVAPVYSLSAEEEEKQDNGVQIQESEAPAEPQEQPVTDVPEEPPVPKKKNGDGVKLALLIAGLVAVVALLAYFLLESFGVSLFPEPTEPTQETVGAAETDGIATKDSYTAEADVAAEVADAVVATFDQQKLSNKLLQVFFYEEFNSFVSEYYSYLSYVGLDLNKSLSEQTCYFDQSMNWEQFLITAAMETWQSYVQMGKLADQNGFELNEEWQATLDSMEASLEEDAKKNNFESADAMLKARYGETCDLAVYKEYVYLLFRANAFYSSQFMFSEEEVSAAFTANEATLAEKGITKTSGLQSSVRHLLVMPEGGTTGANNQKTYTDEEWAACQAAAEALLQEWKAGEATEESFAKLVEKNTDDTASAATGGLYEGIVKDNTYMKEFQDWAVDAQRKPGDTGIVRTTAGCHIMYFVKGEPEWIYFAGQILEEAKYAELQKQMEAVMEEFKVNISYSDILVEKIY